MKTATKETAKTSINLVADLGEGYGKWTIAEDEKLLDIVSSANVACGFHAGDPFILDRTVGMCADKGVAVWAHPGFDDKRNFGRVRIELPQDQLYSDVMYQLGAIQAFADRYGVSLAGVNPHGRLGNLCDAEEYYAEPVFQAIHDFDSKIPVHGAAHSAIGSLAAAEGHELDTKAFPDRNIEPDGSLVLRTHPEALVKEADTIVERALTMVKEREILALDGVSKVKLDFKTLLLHGDKPEAVETAEKLQAALNEQGIVIRSWTD